MNPFTDDVAAARTVLLPLDCPRDALKSIFHGEPQHALQGNVDFDAYLDEAYSHMGIDPTPPTGIQSITDIATLAGLAALRTHRANPLVDTKYDHREPPGSAEKRMLRTPLQKHPGLTQFIRRARQYYIATTLWFFESLESENLQSEIAAILLTPDTDAANDYRAYTDINSIAVNHAYRDKVSINDDGIRLSKEDTSQWCQIRPIAGEWYPKQPDELPRLPVTRLGVTIPWPVFRRKFAEYAYYGWARLAHIAYNTLAPHEQTQLVAETPRAGKTIYGLFKRNNTVYRPYYASDSDNPLREWNSNSATRLPLQLEDKRLITAVDAIRAAPNLSFATPIPITHLYNAIRAYHPPPRRPSNAVSTRDTLVRALENATSDQITVAEDPASESLQCELPQPLQTPFFPATENTDYWTEFLRVRAARTQAPPRKYASQRPGKTNHYLKPAVSKEHDSDHTSTYRTARAAAQQAAALTQSLIPTLDAVKPRLPEAAVPNLTRDELRFVTRVALVMERQIETASLTTSMRPLRHRADGTPLDIDEDKLKQSDWLEHHDEGRELLYTVPAEKRKQLGVTNISNDGFGENTSSEKSLHRKGVDLTAQAIAAKPGVTKVVRYCDLWRLRNTRFEDALNDAGLLSKRIDVIGFNHSRPMHVAEVETKSSDAPKTQRAIDKLSTFHKEDIISASLVTPNPEHLWRIMRHLDHPDYFDFDSFPNSNAKTYGRSSWKNKLQSEDIYPNYLSTIHTYRSLYNELSQSDTTALQEKIIGHV